MKAMRSTVGSRDRLTVTLFLAGLFHLILILGISFAPPAADSGSVPTLEVLLVNNPLPDATRNDSANYLAERTQQGSGNSPDGRTRLPTAGDGPDTLAGAPTGARRRLRPRARSAGDGELLTGQGRRAALRRRGRRSGPGIRGAAARGHCRGRLPVRRQRRGCRARS